MRPHRWWLACGLGVAFCLGCAQPIQTAQPYRVLKTVKVGGVGGFDYVFADSIERHLYAPRTGTGARVSVYNLDTFESAGEIAGVDARGVAIDPRSGHGFASSKPVAMWDSRTLVPIKTIDVQGKPDGIYFDPFNDRVWVLSHTSPHATVIDAKDGSVVGTVDLGGAPEQAVSNGKGTVYIDIQDKDNVAVVAATTRKVTAHYDLGQGGGPSGLALDVKNNVLFVACRKPQTMVIMNAGDGKIITRLPIGAGTDGAVFNANTLEAFSAQGDGTLTVVKENSPTSFVVADTVRTLPRAKTLTLDSGTNRILLITAEFAPPPSPPPSPSSDGRVARGAMVPDTFSILVVGT